MTRSLDQPFDPIRVVTGANRGVGLAIARALAVHGKLVVVGRSKSSAAAAKAAVLKVHPDARVEAFSGDFSSLTEIRVLGQQLVARFPRIDALVHNAAVIAGARTESMDGLELQYQVNHLAPFLLSSLLRAPLQQASGRVVVVASEAHRRASLDLSDLGYERRRYSRNRAYSQSKLANVMFTYALARRWQGSVTVNAVHPGAVSTGLLGAFFGPLFPLRFLFRSTESGAAPVVRLVDDPEVADTTGSYFRRFAQVPSSPASYDEVIQEQLWEASESAVGRAFDE